MSIYTFTITTTDRIVISIAANNHEETTKMKTGYMNVLAIFLTAAAITVLTGCVESVRVGGVKATPDLSAQSTPALQPGAAKDMAPGLKVRFFNERFNSISDMPQGSNLETFGRPGNPVAQLNNSYDKNGDVFGSGKSQLVGIYFSGLIHLPQAGSYSFQAMSNDGIRCFIEDQMIFEDPMFHSDRLTPEGTFKAASPGWYKLRIIYFQKKGKATLKFYWKPPAATGYEVVPAAVLAHRPS